MPLASANGIFFMLNCRTFRFLQRHICFPFLQDPFEISDRPGPVVADLIQG